MPTTAGVGGAVRRLPGLPAPAGPGPDEFCPTETIMPEGHTLHRLATDVFDAFGGRPVTASSPQGRFAEGAARIDGRTLVATEAHGKHFLARFDSEDWLHIHLGLIGTVRFGPAPVPEPVGQVRLRLANDTSYADLRGATVCELLTTPERDVLLGRLGPDPAQPAADRAAADGAGRTQRRRQRVPRGDAVPGQAAPADAGAGAEAVRVGPDVGRSRGADAVRRGDRADRHRRRRAHAGRDGAGPAPRRPRRGGVRLPPAGRAVPRVPVRRTHPGAGGAQPVLVPEVPANRADPPDQPPKPLT